MKQTIQQLKTEWKETPTWKRVLIIALLVVLAGESFYLVQRVKSQLSRDIFVLKGEIKGLREDVAATKERVEERDKSLRADSIAIVKMSNDNAALIAQSNRLRYAINEVKKQNEEVITTYHNLSVVDRFREFASAFPDSVE